MKWNVSQLLKSPVGSERRYELGDDGKGFRELASDVTGRVRLLRTDRGIFVMATGQTKVWCACSRCLDLYPHPVAFEIEEEFFPIIDPLSGSRIRSSCEDQPSFIDSRNELDLGEAVREYALLDIPMKPLCAQECPGLCPTCGAKLGLTACACPPEARDARWSELESLRPSLR